MANLLFIDESGQDRRNSPYEVLAGVAIPDQQLWEFVLDIKRTELSAFGSRYSSGTRELKGKKLLKKKTFRLAAQGEAIDPERRKKLAKECLECPRTATREHLVALSQAKLKFAETVLDKGKDYEFKAFASVVAQNSPRPEPRVLRKDYSYLFQRFYYFLEDVHPEEQGIVVFDELDKARSHILLDQMSCYFTETATGQARANRIIPEPFFVHSDLTTGIQLADLVAYVTSWAIRFHADMTEPARAELEPFARRVENLRYRAIRPRGLFDVPGDEDDEFGIWSFAWIPDLRPRSQRDAM